MQPTTATPRTAPIALPTRITCRDCGTHHRAIVCPICKTATPSFVVIRGRG